MPTGDKPPTNRCRMLSMHSMQQKVGERGAPFASLTCLLEGRAQICANVNFLARTHSLLRAASAIVTDSGNRKSKSMKKTPLYTMSTATAMAFAISTYHFCFIAIGGVGDTYLQRRLVDHLLTGTWIDSQHKFGFPPKTPACASASIWPSGSEWI